jgi:hypothetical protein
MMQTYLNNISFFTQNGDLPFLPGLGHLQPNLEDFSLECNIINDLFQQRPIQVLIL